MNDYFDVIIIGGGLAGLCAGAYITRDNHSLLICEQADQTGGYFRTFNKDGFYFDAGLKAVENAGMLIPMLKQLDLDDQVNLHKATSAIVLEDRFIALRKSHDFDQLFEVLSYRFPQEKKGLKSISHQADRIAQWVNIISSIPNPLFEDIKLVLPKMPTWFIQNLPGLISFKHTGNLLNVPLTAFLSNYLSDLSLINVLSELFFEGTPALFGLGYSKYFTDYYYPQKGMQSLTDSLSGYINIHGGTIKTGARVEQILFQNGRAAGVKLDDGSAFYSRFVISASDMRNTFTKMIDPINLPYDFNKRIAEAKIGESSVCVFAAADIPVSRLPVQKCPHLFVIPDYQGVEPTDTLYSDYFARSPIEISIPCLNNPELAPPGKSGIIISAIARYDFNANWNRQVGEATAAYYALKEKVADQLIETASMVIPGLKEHIIFRQIATPYTYKRYTLNRGGSICGWTYDRQNTFLRNNSGGIRRSVLTPFDGLLQAGHWTMYPGGAPVCILTGRLAADHINRQLQREKKDVK